MSLSPDQVKKVSDAASAVELQALKDVIARQRAGKKLTGADLRLLERLQQKHAASENQDDSQQDMRWVPIPEVVKLIGGTEQGWRGFTRRKENPLPCRQTERGACIQPWTAFEYGTKFARNVKNLRPPPTHKPDSSPQESAPIEAAFTGDPHQVLLQAVQILQSGAFMTSQNVTAIASAARELRQKSESDLKAARLFDADTVVQMLKDHRDFYISKIEDSAQTDAQAIVEHITKNVGIDLSEKNVAAASIIESFLRSRANELLEEIRTLVLSQIETINNTRATA